MGVKKIQYQKPKEKLKPEDFFYKKGEVVKIEVPVRMKNGEIKKRLIKGKIVRMGLVSEGKRAGEKGYEVEYETSKGKKKRRIAEVSLDKYNHLDAGDAVGQTRKATLKVIKSAPEDKTESLDDEWESEAEEVLDADWEDLAEEVTNDSVQSGPPPLSIDRLKASIINGAEEGKMADSLAEGSRKYNVLTDGETRIDAVAATYEGYKYSHGRNEDRVVISGKGVTVIDGMGGGSRGDEGADILARAIEKKEDNLLLAAQDGLDEMAKAGLKPGKDGACFLSIKPPEIGERLMATQVGDPGLFHVSGSDARIKYQDSDRLNMNDIHGKPLAQQTQSVVEFVMSGDYKKMSTYNKKMLFTGVGRKAGLTHVQISTIHTRIDKGEPVLPEGDAIYWKMRSVVGRTISPGEKLEPIQFETREIVEEGDIIFLMSDGVTDNFTSAELKSFAEHIIKNKWTAEQATKVISDELHKRMKQANKANRFKRDNASIVVLIVHQGDQKKKKKKAA